MPDYAKRQASADAKRAQKRYEQAKANIDQAAEERRKSFERAREAGFSLAEIGKAVGLHRSRVDQILRRK